MTDVLKRRVARLEEGGTHAPGFTLAIEDDEWADVAAAIRSRLPAAGHGGPIILHPPICPITEAWIARYGHLAR